MERLSDINKMLSEEVRILKDAENVAATDGANLMSAVEKIVERALAGETDLLGGGGGPDDTVPTTAKVGLFF